MKKRLAIIGGGPSALFLLRRLIAEKATGYTIDIFERNAVPGAGMPYSPDGAGPEHVTNVSGNEIPALIDRLEDWIKDLPKNLLRQYDINPATFSAFHVVPRLLFGEYLNDQFEQYIDLARQAGITVHVHLNIAVTDLQVQPGADTISVLSGSRQPEIFDTVVVACGHRWPERKAGTGTSHFNAPYPPARVASIRNKRMSLKGSSLTAIDAVRTLARANGVFSRDPTGHLRFESDPACEDFTIHMGSLDGILPGLRFHLADPRLSTDRLMSKEEIRQHKTDNNGFVSLDYLFRRNFIDQLEACDPAYYDQVKDQSLEDFAAKALRSFKTADSFACFAREYEASLRSIRERQPAWWREKLALFSVSMNFPAKYLSAEDMKRYHAHLMPLIGVIIAFAPQSSAEELLALHAAGKLFVAVREGDDAAPDAVHIDCTGQPHLWIDDFPFRGLVTAGAVSQACLRSRNDGDWSEVPGLAITDNFRAVDTAGKSALSLFLMAAPYIGGFNPDYSGLDFCDDASQAIVEELKGLA